MMEDTSSYVTVLSAVSRAMFFAAVMEWDHATDGYMIRKTGNRYKSKREAEDEAVKMAGERKLEVR